MKSQKGDSERDDFAPAALPKETRREFLIQASLLNLGVLSAGAGLIVIMFTKQMFEGALLTGLGVLLLAQAAWRYSRKSPTN